MKTIDTRGKLCPQPLIETRKALKSSEKGESLQILSDNEIAKNNIIRFLNDQNIENNCSTESGIYKIIIQGNNKIDDNIAVEEYCSIESTPSILPNSRYAVVIDSDKMGEGDDDLGAILIRGFINALIEQEKLPSHIIFYNAGVHLSNKKSSVAHTLYKLQEKEIQIIVCGTCVDFYEINPKCCIGTISNMYEITEILTNASHIIKP
ncbi:MAG: sulfurtransferase-like selenium metabolism protein YedF [Bacteroidales bacterium]